MVELLTDVDFEGGLDNVPALVAGLLALEPYQNTELLWVHGLQPVLFEHSLAAITQTLERLTQIPNVALYPVIAGPNLLLDQSKLAYFTHTVAANKSLADYLSQLFSTEPGWIFSRTEQATNDAITAANGSPHIGRLWANEQIASLLDDQNQQAAIALAAEYQLVTAVSGAVVLESVAQYEENGLKPVDKISVPTIPEPHQWVLILLTLVLLLWFFSHSKSNLLKPQ